MNTAPAPVPEAISPEAVAALPIRRYDGRVELVETAEALARAMADIRRERVVGFDTETRPAFRKGESHLPSLVQIATARAVYLFRLDRVDCAAELAEILAAPGIAKAGVALAHDLRQLGLRFPIAPAAVVDLGKVAHRHGLSQSGLRNLAAIFLAFRIPKGARTTNWAAPTLKPAQIGYAATDAWASRELFLCFEKRGLLAEENAPQPDGAARKTNPARRRRKTEAPAASVGDTADPLAEIIEAHGGEARWRRLETIEASFSSGGLAFSLHMQPMALRGLRVTLRPHARHLVLHDYGGAGRGGIWTPDKVSLLDESGSTVAERAQPRRMFSRPDRMVRWDRLDLLYFAGYALWNYLSFPFLLRSPGVELMETGQAGNLDGRRLTARFDDDVPTHSRLQTFHLDRAGLLTRHDYTADVIGRWAKAANLCLASEVVDGLRFYTRRKVYPRLGAEGVSPWPTLVWIELDDIRLGTGPHKSPAQACLNASAR